MSGRPSIPTETHDSKLRLKDCPVSIQRLVQSVAEEFQEDVIWPSVDELHLRRQEEGVADSDFDAFGRQAFATHSVQGSQYWRLNLWAMYDTGRFELPFEKAREVIDRAFGEIKANRTSVTVSRTDVARHLRRQWNDDYVTKVQYIFERSYFGYQLHPDHGWQLSVDVSRCRFPTPSIEDLFLDRPPRPSHLAATDVLVPGDAFATDATELATPKSTKVFIVHGHDDGLKETIARFIERLGLSPIILHEQASRGRTIAEKLEANHDVGFAIVLLTPDDMGRLNAPEAKEQPRARQNVILELGYFWAKLGRANVCALVDGTIEYPSDYKNVVYVSFDPAGGWKLELVKELRAAGYQLDMKALHNG